MTPEMLVVVVLGLVVKYTLEFADRTGPFWGRRRAARRRRSRGAGAN